MTSEQRGKDSAGKTGHVSPEAQRRELQHLEDDQLVVFALDGRLDAFNALIERHQRYIRGICHNRVGMAEGDDVAQNTFIKAWSSLDSYNQAGKFRAWLSTIARNACNDLLRQRQRRPTSSLDQMVDDVGDHLMPASTARSPDEVIENIELGVELQAALKQLPVHQRVAVVYRDVMEWSYEEIADATGWSLGTVKSRISRGRAAMREQMTQLHSGEQS